MIDMSIVYLRLRLISFLFHCLFVETTIKQLGDESSESYLALDGTIEIHSQMDDPTSWHLSMTS